MITEEIYSPLKKERNNNLKLKLKFNDKNFKGCLLNFYFH